MLKCRPWLIRDTLWADSTFVDPSYEAGFIVDPSYEAGFILSFKKVLWANPRTTLDLGKSWRFFGNVARYNHALQCPGSESVTEKNVMFGCFKRCDGVGRQVGLSWDLLYWQCKMSGPGMVTGNYSLKQHNTLKYLAC